MFGTLKGRLLIIAAVIIGSIAIIATRGITRGLDLSGGIYLALEVQDDGTMTPEVRREHTQQNLHILRNRVDQLGGADRNVQSSGDYRIIVELPGESDIERARAIIGQTALLEWQLVSDLAPLINVLPRMDRAVVAALEAQGEAADLPDADTPRGMQQDVRDRLFGTQQDTAAADSAAAADSVAAAAESGAPARTPLSDLLRGGADGGEIMVPSADVERVKRYLTLPGVSELLPRNTELAWDVRERPVGATLYRSLYLLETPAFLTGERLENATAGRDPQYNMTIVQFELDRRGGRDFQRITSANIGRRIAIVLDDEVHSAPSVRGAIGSTGQIEMGQASMEEASDLALVLRAGAFSAPLHEVENRTIRPSLGQDSIDQGKIAGIIGIVLVILIMVTYYRLAGVLSVIALGIYFLLLMAGMSAFGFALTAPGIAGLILSLGMAVDANVLIFERIREELQKGRNTRAAVDAGFQHAMSAIVDSNITTLITALILYQAGTGPVKGFAITLSIGIVASFFSAVFITRTFMMLYLDRRRTADALSI